MISPDLIIETGAIVTGADSWVTQADYVAYARNLGLNVDGTEAQKQALRQAAIFIGTHEGKLKGELISRNQPLCFPRSDLVIDGWEWNDDEIPRQVKLCQMQLAIEIQSGIDLYNRPASESNAVKREKIEGAVEIEYAVTDAQKLSKNSTSRALLASLLRNSGLMSIPLERA